MKKFLAALTILFLLGIFVTPAYARSGCCSHHGGVSGCGCADGTPLSATCLPYYPECSNGGQVDTAPVTYTPVTRPTEPLPTYTPVPTDTPLPTVTPKPKKKLVKKHVKKKIVKPTPTPIPTSHKNFFQWLFGL